MASLTPRADFVTHSNKAAGWFVVGATCHPDWHRGRHAATPASGRELARPNPARALLQWTTLSRPRRRRTRARLVLHCDRPRSAGQRARSSSRASVRPGSPEATASGERSSVSVRSASSCAPRSCMELGSAGPAAAFNRGSDGRGRSVAPGTRKREAARSITITTRKELPITAPMTFASVAGR